MPVIDIFSGALGVTFAPTQPFLLHAEKVTVDFVVDVTIGPAVVEWYLEYTSGNPNDTNTIWYREVAEEDVGGGVVHMPKVVRNLEDNDDDNHQLTQGIHYMSAQMVRAHNLCRLQVRLNPVPVAMATMRITVPIGYPAVGA